MTLKRYTIGATSAEAWHRIHNLLTFASSEEYVPDRSVTCTNSKPQSAVRSTYELSEDEVAALRNHADIAWVELSTRDNPEAFPRPMQATIQNRFGGSKVKTYRTITGVGNSVGEENRTNWGVARVGFETYGDAHGTNDGSIYSYEWTPSGSPDGVAFQFVYDGSNVDVVVMDSGVYAAHPEFLNDDGTSRVKDIVLDAPYLIDPTWFTVTNSYTYTRWDGSIGIATDKAIEWWEFGAQRSAIYANIGTVQIDNTNYTAAKAGVAGTTVSLLSGHGTAAASVAAGKNFGHAPKATVWNMPCVTDNVGMGIEDAYDLIRIFHTHKPVDGTLGVKKPTVVNSSWGYQAAATLNGFHNVRFEGTQSLTQFTNGITTASQNPSWLYYPLTNQVSGAYKSWTSSARSLATDEAGKEMMDAGVIHIAAAGNNNQKIGVGTDDNHELDAIEDKWFASGDPRPEFTNYGSNLTPIGHKKWMNPMGIGWTSAGDPLYYPVITVGALDDVVQTGAKERKVTYSNNGPGIDVWAPADDMLAAGSPTSGYQDYVRYNSSFYDAYFNGTSAASPVVAGVVACFLQRFPSASSIDVRNWLTSVTGDSGSRDNTNFVYDEFPSSIYDENDYRYWNSNYNLRGAPHKTLYLNPTSAIGTTAGGVNTPTLTQFPEEGVFRAGIALTSGAYDPIGGSYESGTLKKVQFQVATDYEFNNIVYDTPTDDNNLEQSFTGVGAQTYYMRVKHLSNADGSSFTAYESAFSGIVSFRTNVPSFGVAQPTILEPAENQVIDNVTGLKLRSSAYSPINGAAASGTLKGIEFQVLSSLEGGDSAESYTVYVTAAQQGGYGGDYYTFGGAGSDRNGAVTGNAPTINITQGDTLTIDLTAISGHPMAIRTGLGATSASGVTGEGTSTIVWDTTGLPAGTYYYQCMSHPSMNGQIVLSAPSGGSETVVWESTGLNDTSEIQTVGATLQYGTTYYIRTRHVSNADGTSLTSSTSAYSPVRTITTAGFANNAFGRTRNLVTSLTQGVVTPVLLYEAPELVEVTVTVSNKTNLRSNYSVGLSSSFGFKDSDYLSYGIPISVGEATHLEKIHMKPGDKIFVNSFDPGVNFSAYTTKFFRNISSDSALVHGRSKSLTSSLNPPSTINDELSILDATENSLATVHATNKNSDVPVAISVGISSGGIGAVKQSDFIVFGLRLQPLQDFRVDEVGISTGQTLFVRASRPNVSFVAYSRPSEDGPSGVGTVASVNTSGIITAAQFVGDGSGLTGVTAVGSGIEVKDSGSSIGVAATVNFGDRLTVSAISAGIVTITAADSVSLATTATNLDPSFIPERSTYANYATVAGVATVATTANTAQQATNATTANLALGISTEATINNPTRDITARKFFGDGSQLQNIVAAGSGVVIKDDGTLVGTAGSINLLSPLTVTSVSAGIVTVGVDEVPRATLAGIASEAIVCGLATFATNAGIASQALNANFASAASFSTLTGAADTAKNLYTESRNPFLPLPVTFGTKSSAHRYTGVGSESTINIQGYEAPYLRFEVGQTYRFENAAQQVNYPIRLYYAADGLPVGFGTTSPNQYLDNVTETGTYTEILVTENTPQLLYYGAGIGTTMGSMGNSIQVFNSDFHKISRVGEFKNLSGLQTCTYTQMFEGRATSWYMNTNLGVGNSDYTPGDRSHNVSSIVQTATGTYNINFADAMNDTNYAVIGIASGTNAFPGGIVNLRISDRTVNGYTMRVYNGIPALEDLGELSIMTLGGQDGEPTYI